MPEEIFGVDQTTAYLFMSFDSLQFSWGGGHVRT